MSTPLRSTVVYDVSRGSPEDAAAIALAAEAIREGSLVALPTETVYGLGANALDPQAVTAIFEAKGRPADNPLIVHIGGLEDLEGVAASVPSKARKLAAAFWPGPLTMVLPRGPQVPAATSAGLDTVAVRMPAHPVALALIRGAGTPIAAPSANPSGRPSPTCAEHVVQDLWGRVDIVLDGGPCEVGVESTVLDVTMDPPVLLRPGGVTLEALECVAGRVLVPEAGHAGQRRSPGTRHRHYAPRARVALAEPGDVPAQVRRYASCGFRVAVMASGPVTGLDEGIVVKVMSPKPEEYARELFGALRELDAQGSDIIIVETIGEEGMGRAVMDRLRRAAEVPGKRVSPRRGGNG